MSNITKREGSEGHDDEDQQERQFLQEAVEVSYFHYNDTGVGSWLTTVFFRTGKLAKYDHC
ncbi:unnamed protein product [Meloidogyne enterolobii]|uniref:Uncharacterized protein n=1 Tax=Meloidogyne enterolobii TaxID=390850 RepID=A0ACB0YCI3_MELEN